jgi:hypothetical protein
LRQLKHHNLNSEEYYYINYYLLWPNKDFVALKRSIGSKFWASKSI